jgi:hypothetical protein
MTRSKTTKAKTASEAKGEHLPAGFDRDADGRLRYLGVRFWTDCDPCEFRVVRVHDLGLPKGIRVVRVDDASLRVSTIRLSAFSASGAPRKTGFRPSTAEELRRIGLDPADAAVPT